MDFLGLLAEWQMSEQLVGVIVGALIGFSGTLLTVLIHSKIEKDKRREERLWHLRKDRLERKIEPAWQATSTLLYELVDCLDSALQMLKQLQEVADLDQEADTSTKAAFDNFLKRWMQISSAIDTFSKHDLRTIEALYEIEIARAISNAVSSSLGVIGDVGKEIEDLFYRRIHDVRVGSGEISAAIQDLSKAEAQVSDSVRKVEKVIEKHLTKL